MNATNLQLKFAPAFACSALLASSLLASHAQAAEFVDASEVGDGLPGTGRQLLELTVCVRESAGALVPASRAGGPMTARNYVEDELEELQRQLFELTQGKLVLRHVDVMYDGDNASEDGCGAIQGKKVDIDWRLTMDPFCISGADPGEVATTCSWAVTERSIQDATARAERSADPLVDGAGHLPCDTWQHGTDHVALWGTAVDLNALGEDNDFGAESVAHELGHYLFCLEDAYASPDWNPSYYTGNLWRWFNKQDDPPVWRDNFKWVYIDEGDDTTVMSNHLVGPWSNAEYDPAINDCREINPDAPCNTTSPYAGSGEIPGVDSCRRKLSDHETKTMHAYWTVGPGASEPNWADLPAALAGMDESQYDRDEWWQWYGDTSENFLVSNSHGMPFMFSDWDVLENGDLGSAFNWREANPGRNVYCAPLDELVEQEYGPEATLPEVEITADTADNPEDGTYLLIDVSGSMSVADGSGKTAAERAQDAGRQIFFQATRPDVNTRKLGMAAYSAGPVQELLAYGHHPDLTTQPTQDALGGYISAGGLTDIYGALVHTHGEIQGQADPSFPQDLVGQEVILMTDGKQTVSCPSGQPDECEVEQASQMAAWGAMVRVIAFGNENADKIAGISQGLFPSLVSSGRNSGSLHRMRMAITNEYVRTRGRQQIVALRGVQPVTGTQLVEGGAFVWKVIDFTVPDGTTSLFASVHPRFAPGDRVGVSVLTPDDEVFSGGLGENETMNNGGFAGATIFNPPPGSYQLLAGAVGVVDGAEIYSPFDEAMDINVVADISGVRARVWTPTPIVDGSAGGTFLAQATLRYELEHITGATVVVDVYGDDETLLGSFTMNDAAQSGDYAAGDGYYSVEIPVSVLQGYENFTLNAHFEVPASATFAIEQRRSRRPPGAYQGGAFDIHAEYSAAVNFAVPNTYRATIDLTQLGGGAVEPGESYVGTIGISNASPTPTDLIVDLGAAIHMEYVRRAEPNGGKSMYNVGFTVDPAAELGLRDLTVNFKGVRRVVPEFLDVVGVGAGDFGDSDTVQELNAIADASLRVWLANTPHGDDVRLHVGSNEIYNWDRSLIRFSDSALASAVGSDRLRRAVLELVIDGQDANWAEDNSRLVAHAMTMDWDEQRATWNCAADTGPWNLWEDCNTADQWRVGGPDTGRPWAFEQVPDGWTEIEDGQVAKVQIDVTAIVEDWLDEPADNFGVALTLAGDPWPEWVNFKSRESGQGPKLILNTY